ncbi:MAG TPA: hypothetical protein VGC82_06390 [Rhodopila sp.]
MTHSGCYLRICQAAIGSLDQTNLAPKPFSKIQQMRDQRRNQRRRDPRPRRTRQTHAQGKHEEHTWQQHQPDTDQTQGTNPESLENRQRDCLDQRQRQNHVNQVWRNKKRGKFTHYLAG